MPTREIAGLASRFPRHELVMRRLHAHDQAFRAICEDYYEAMQALRHWQSAGTSSGDRVEQYREMLNDLESEVLRIIEGVEKNGSKSNRKRG